MKVSELMTRGVVTVRADAGFREVALALIEHDVSGVPVVDASGAVVGVIGESDLLAKEAYPRRARRRLARLAHAMVGEPKWLSKANGLTARDLMSSPPITIGSNEDMHGAARTMFEREIKRLPVVDDGRLVGILSRHDVLRVYARTDEQLTRIVEDFLRRCFYVPPDHEIEVGVSDGIVTLSGVVLHASDARIAPALVASIDGVVGVDHRLTYRHEDPRTGEVSNGRWGIPSSGSLPA